MNIKLNSSVLHYLMLYYIIFHKLFYIFINLYEFSFEFKCFSLPNIALDVFHMRNNIIGKLKIKIEELYKTFIIS